MADVNAFLNFYVCIMQKFIIVYWKLKWRASIYLQSILFLMQKSRGIDNYIAISPRSPVGIEYEMLYVADRTW